MKIRLLIFFCCVGLVGSVSAQVKEIGVSGGDVETLMSVVEGIDDYSEDTVIIVLGDGRYELEETVNLKEVNEKVVLLRAENSRKVIFAGGKLLSDKWTKLKRGDVKDLLSSEARKNVMQLDLKAEGISDYGTLKGRGFSMEVRPMQMELFCNAERMQLARWPNYDIDAPYEGKAQYGEVLEVGAIPRHGDTSNLPAKFVFKDKRASKWMNNKDVWLHGVWAYDWADRSMPLLDVDEKKGTITVGCSQYGAHPNKYFYVVNAISELDCEGEYYIDRNAGMLYFWPTGELKELHLSVSMMEEPLLVIEECSNVTVEGIVFQEGRSVGVNIVGGDHNTIDNCVVRAMGSAAINIGEGQDEFEIVGIGYGGGNSGLYRNTGWDRNGGSFNGVKNSEIYDIAAYGILLGGGNRQSLTPAHNYVENCDVHHVARIYEQMFSNVHIDGVGNRVSNCELSYNPHSVIMFWGNDHLIEYNEIHHAVYNSSDAGAIYTGRDPSQTGSVIRWNFFHNIYGNHDFEGVFFDDGASGLRVEGNIFYDIQSRGATKYHGGQNNTFVNNLVVDCVVPVGYQLWNQSKWNDFLKSDLAKERLFSAVNILEEPYVSAYPWLSRVFDVPYAKNSHVEERNYLTTVEDPLFENGTEMDFRITDWKKLREKVPGIQIIPVEKIGLKAKARRLISPVYVMKTQRLFPGQEFEIAPAKLMEEEEGLEIYYTVDGSEPDRHSLRYSEPLQMVKPGVVKARIYKQGLSDELASNVKVLECELPAGTIYLDELYPEEIIAHNGIKMNHNYAFSNFVYLDGKKYEHSVMACPTKDERYSRLVYDLSFADGKMVFESDYGLDVVSTNGSAEFIVKAIKDGKEKELFRSERITEGGKLHELKLDVSGYDKLVLECTDGGDNIWGDHCVWGEARFFVE